MAGVSTALSTSSLSFPTSPSALYVDRFMGGDVPGGTPNPQHYQHPASGLGVESGDLCGNSPFPVSPFLQTSVEQDIAELEKVKKALSTATDFYRTLEQQLWQIDNALSRNKMLQESILRQTPSANKGLTTRPSAQYFIDMNSPHRPPDNPHTIAKREQGVFDRLPLVYKSKKWSNPERGDLWTGVRCIAQKLAEEEQIAKLGHGEVLSSCEAQSINRMDPMDMEERARSFRPEHWSQIAKSWCKSRTADECKLQWYNWCSPIVNTRAWDHDEDVRLMKLAKKYGEYQWSQIAQELGTHRTALQCLSRYTRSLGSMLNSSKWTKEEDEALRRAVQKYGESNWQMVAEEINPINPRRNGPQCLHRWMKSTQNPNIKRSRWEREEDMRLYMAVHAYGSQWAKVREHVPGRSDVQCRERWCNVLNPSLSTDDWAPEEDEALMKAVKLHGVGKWSRVAGMLAPRTDNQVWRRWKFLSSEEEVEKHRERTLKRNKAGPLAQNFQGREKERSSLNEEDFQIEELMALDSRRPRKKRRQHPYSTWQFRQKDMKHGPIIVLSHLEATTEFNRVLHPFTAAALILIAIDVEWYRAAQYHAALPQQTQQQQHAAPLPHPPHTHMSTQQETDPKDDQNKTNTGEGEAASAAPQIQHPQGWMSQLNPNVLTSMSANLNPQLYFSQLGYPTGTGRTPTPNLGTQGATTLPPQADVMISLQHLLSMDSNAGGKSQEEGSGKEGDTNSAQKEVDPNKHSDTPQTSTQAADAPTSPTDDSTIDVVEGLTNSSKGAQILPDNDDLDAEPQHLTSKEREKEAEKEKPSEETIAPHPHPTLLAAQLPQPLQTAADFVSPCVFVEGRAPLPSLPCTNVSTAALYKLLYLLHFHDSGQNQAKKPPANGSAAPPWNIYPDEDTGVPPTLESLMTRFRNRDPATGALPSETVDIHKRTTADADKSTQEAPLPKAVTPPLPSFLKLLRHIPPVQEAHRRCDQSAQWGNVDKSIFSRASWDFGQLVNTFCALFAHTVLHYANKTRIVYPEFTSVIKFPPSWTRDDAPLQPTTTASPSESFNSTQQPQAVGGSVIPPPQPQSSATAGASNTAIGKPKRAAQKLVPQQVHLQAQQQPHQHQHHVSQQETSNNDILMNIDQDTTKVAQQPIAGFRGDPNPGNGGVAKRRVSGDPPSPHSATLLTPTGSDNSSTNTPKRRKVQSELPQDDADTSGRRKATTTKKDSTLTCPITSNSPPQQQLDDPLGPRRSGRVPKRNSKLAGYYTGESNEADAGAEPAPVDTENSYTEADAVEDSFDNATGERKP